MGGPAWRPANPWRPFRVRAGGVTVGIRPTGTTPATLDAAEFEPGGRDDPSRCDRGGGRRTEAPSRRRAQAEGLG